MYLNHRLLYMQSLEAVVSLQTQVTPESSRLEGEDTSEDLYRKDSQLCQEPEPPPALEVMGAVSSHWLVVLKGWLSQLLVCPQPTQEAMETVVMEMVCKYFRKVLLIEEFTIVYCFKEELFRRSGEEQPEVAETVLS